MHKCASVCKNFYIAFDLIFLARSMLAYLPGTCTHAHMDMCIKGDFSGIKAWRILFSGKKECAEGTVTSLPRGDLCVNLHLKLYVCIMLKCTRVWNVWVCERDFCIWVISWMYLLHSCNWICSQIGILKDWKKKKSERSVCLSAFSPLARPHLYYIYL